MPPGWATVTSSRCAGVGDSPEGARAHVGNLDDLWEGEMLAVSLGGVDLVMCNVQGEVFAFDNRCPHLASRLSDGRFDGQLITCAAHEWVFDARGGNGVNPIQARLRRHRTWVIGNDIYVDLHEVTP
jgi:toluene monooxygenase system ferredoxin subunit